MSSVYNLRVWCSFCARPRETSLTNTREKNFPRSPTLLHSHPPPAAGRPARPWALRKPTGVARNEMMKVATVQTYPYFSLMIWLIFLQSAPLRGCLPAFSAVETANAHRRRLPEERGRLTGPRTTEMKADQIWKWNFPSVNHLSRRPIHRQSGGAPGEGGPVGVRVPRGPLASLIKILAEDQSCAQIRGTSSHGSRNILSRFSRCYR